MKFVTLLTTSPAESGHPGLPPPAPSAPGVSTPSTAYSSAGLPTLFHVGATSGFKEQNTTVELLGVPASRLTAARKPLSLVACECARPKSRGVALRVAGWVNSTRVVASAWSASLTSPVPKNREGGGRNPLRDANVLGE